MPGLDDPDALKTMQLDAGLGQADVVCTLHSQSIGSHIMTALKASTFFTRLLSESADATKLCLLFSETDTGFVCGKHDCEFCQGYNTIQALTLTPEESKVFEVLLCFK